MTDVVISAIALVKAADACNATDYEAGRHYDASYAVLSAARDYLVSITPQTDEGARALAIWVAEDLRRDGDAPLDTIAAAERLADWARGGMGTV